MSNLFVSRAVYAQGPASLTGFNVVSEKKDKEDSGRVRMLQVLVLFLALLFMVSITLSVVAMTSCKKGDRYGGYNKGQGHVGDLQGLNWKSCGSSSDPIQIRSLSISPIPVIIPGNITLSLLAYLQVDLQSPIQIELDLKKHIPLGRVIPLEHWITLPCIDNVGSCTYNDICGHLASIMCPPHINCRCPFQRGVLNIPSAYIAIPDIGLPAWLEDGDYMFTAMLSTRGQSLGCLFAQFSLKKLLPLVR